MQVNEIDKLARAHSEALGNIAKACLQDASLADRLKYTELAIQALGKAHDALLLEAEAERIQRAASNEPFLTMGA